MPDPRTPALAFALAVVTALASPACAEQTPAPDAASATTSADADASAYADPAAEAMNAQAPEVFDAKFTTSGGDFVVRTHRAWAPHGADRFYNLVRSGFFDDQRVFRVVPGFVAQWGIHGDPEVSEAWRAAQIKDDPILPEVPNTTGRLVFANAGPHTRTTQLFVNLEDNPMLDDPIAMGGSVFAPFGEVIEGLDAVRAINADYPDTGRRSPYRLPPEEHTTPDQAYIQAQGNAYLDQFFPKLTKIETAEIVDAQAGDAAEAVEATAEAAGE